MAKQNTNDKTVMDLKKQVAEKKAALATRKVFHPMTNCSLRLHNEIINIRTCNGDRLVELLVQMNSLRLSARDLGLNAFEFSGFNISWWVEDLKCLLEDIERKQEESRLRVLETKLHVLLSTDKKVELEIEDLKSQI